jgi:drug/metabolite transporter (DMT)-like permease
MARGSLGIAPVALLTFAALSWAVGTVVAKFLLEAVPPLTFLVLQLLPSQLLLWTLVLARGAPAVHRRQLVEIAALGWLNPGLAYTFSMLGLTATTASIATLLWAAEPAVILAAAWLLLREAVTARLVAAIAGAAAGVLLVSAPAGVGGLAAQNSGAALILAGVLCCAIYTVLSRRIAGQVDALFIVAVQQTVGLAWAIAIWPLELRRELLWPAVSGELLLGAAVSGLLYYGAAFWCYLSALRSVPASTAGLFLNLTPVFGVAIAFLALGERLTSAQWLGAAIILASVLGLLAGERRAPAS